MSLSLLNEVVTLLLVRRARNVEIEKEIAEMEANSDHQSDRDDDAVVRALKACDIAVTRENYIKLIYGDEPPEYWGAEQERQLPEYLQDWSYVGKPTKKHIKGQPRRRKRKR
jgi:hypothetical protein